MGPNSGDNSQLSTSCRDVMRRVCSTVRVWLVHATKVNIESRQERQEHLYVYFLVWSTRKWKPSLYSNRMSKRDCAGGVSRGSLKIGYRLYKGCVEYRRVDAVSNPSVETRSPFWIVFSLPFCPNPGSIKCLRGSQNEAYGGCVVHYRLIPVTVMHLVLWLYLYLLVPMGYTRKWKTSIYTYGMSTVVRMLRVTIPGECPGALCR